MSDNDPTLATSTSELWARGAPMSRMSRKIERRKRAAAYEQRRLDLIEKLVDEGVDRAALETLTYSELICFKNGSRTTE